MDTDSGIRWLAVAVVVVAIVALMLLARGGTERGNPDASPGTAVAELGA
jgi:hypothetical protein